MERRLHRNHVARATHPAAAQRTKRLPSLGTEHAVHDGVSRNKADRNRNAGREEAAQHTRAELEHLADVTAQQHQAQHRIQDIILERTVCPRSRLHIPCTDRAQQHGQQVQQHHRRHKLEKLPLGQLFCAYQHGRQKYQHHTTAFFLFF